VGQADDDVQKGLPFDVEGDILDDDSCGDDFIVVSLNWSGRRIDLRCWRGTSSGRKVRVIVRRERPVIGGEDGTVQPLLWCSVSPWFENGKSVKKRTEGNPALIVLFLRGDWPKVSGLYWD